MCIRDSNEALSLYSKLEEQVNSNYQEAVQDYRIANLSTRITTQPKAWMEDVKDLKLTETKFENEV